MGKNQMSGLLLLTLLLLPIFGFARVEYDFFDHPRWEIFTDGSGPRIIERNQRLEILLPASSAESGGGGFSGNYLSVCRLRGDFDIRVTYALLNFPAFNGVRVGLVVSESGQVSSAAVERTSFSQHDALSPGEAYLTDFGGVTRVSTTDKRGRLRLMRTGNTLTGYYFDHNFKEWKSISSASYTINDVYFSIAAWSHDAYFDDKEVRVAFDSVIINQGRLIGACQY